MTEAPKDERYRAYREAIRRRVCAVCLDQRDDGACQLEHSRVCAIDGHLAGLVEAIVAIDSSRMDDYEQAIRAQVCGPCHNQDSDGHCRYREGAECALWTYLPLVVDAVEEVRGTLGPAQGTAGR